MSQFRMLRLAIGLAVVLSARVSVVRAQTPGPPGAEATPPGAMGGALRAAIGPENPVAILLAPAVQQELKLTDAQKTKVYALSRTMTQKGRDLAQGVMLGGGINPQALMMARYRLRQEAEQEIAQFLDATQRERFNQIALQAEGPLAVARPEIASKLRINDTQNGYIQAIMLQMQQGQREMMMGMRRAAVAGQFDPSQGAAQMREATTKLRENAVQQIGKILDRKQKANFNKMLGEPFDLTKLTVDGGQTPAPAEDAKAQDAPEPKKDAAKSSDRPARGKARAKSGSNP